jgi:glycosyltransferase involved in cell wall biosynthesis
VVSSVIANSIKNKFPNLKAKVSILPIFVDVKKIMEREVGFGSSNNIPNILMVSRFAKEKRIEDGLEAFRKLVVDKNIDARLNIFGAGPEKENIISRINELGLVEKVKILEWENDVILVFKKAQIYLLTSEYEGYGMTLIEAAASGVPIVTTNVGVAKTEIFKDGYNCHVCSVGDTDDVANRLEDLIINPDKRKLFKDRMQDSIRSVSISREEYVVNYTNLLKHLIKNA